MKIIDTMVFEGPNLYSLSPVIVMDLNLSVYKDVETKHIDDFNQQLLFYFPTLKEHHCSLGRPGGFVTRLEKGTFLGHVMEHLALELQHLCGDSITYGSTRSLGPGRYRLIYAYRLKELGVAAGQEAFSIIKRLLEGEAIDLDSILSYLKEIYRQKGLGPSTEELIKAAKKEGIPVMVLDGEKSLIQLGYGARQQRLAATITHKTSCLAVDIACDKVQTKKLLKEMGLPVAKGYEVASDEEALERLVDLGLPVVVKPCHGNQGQGVLTGLKSREELLEALNISREISPYSLLEEHIQGRDYRILVVNNRVVAVAERRPAHVVGDGHRSIEELIDELNEDPRRGLDHERPLTKIYIEKSLLFHLSCQGYDLAGVPRRGEVVTLQCTGNLSSGGTSMDVTSLIHPETTSLILLAVSFVGLDVAGVDIITPHISHSLKEKGAILEINAAPGLRMHHYPTRGLERNVSKAIIDMLFPGEEKGRIPLLAISGTNGKTTITRLLSFMLKREGLVVGSATSEGIYVDDRLLVEGDMTGPWSARYILKHPKVEACVLETARGGLLREGLGFNSCKLALLSNISWDHLGHYGIETLEEMAHLKGLLLEVVEEDGYSIINADDPYLLNLARRARGEILYTSSTEKNTHLHEHLQTRGRGVYEDEKGRIILAQGDRREVLLKTEDVPLTLKGRARYQLENVLLAIAAAWAIGLPHSLIASSLRRFRTEEHNLGRFNIFKGGGITIILDYAHNLEGYRSAISTAERVFGDPLIGVVGMPGDRRDEDIIEVGRLAGRSFHKVYVKEDEDLRGRREGEVADLFMEGISSAGKGSSFKKIRDEVEAIKVAVFEASLGDTILFFYEKESRERVRIIQESLRRKESVEIPQLLDC